MTDMTRISRNSASCGAIWLFSLALLHGCGSPAIAVPPKESPSHQEHAPAAPASLPFAIKLGDPFTVDGMPGLQSYACGSANVGGSTKWLFVARTVGGVHGFSANSAKQGHNFPRSGANTNVFVVDPAAPTSGNGVILIEKLAGATSIGYIFGGIQSRAPYSTARRIDHGFEHVHPRLGCSRPLRGEGNAARPCTSRLIFCPA